jgi:hypothetical protein
MKTICLAVIALIFIPAVAEAQPNCKKGKPCGNSCIAVSKTCRIGTAEPEKKPVLSTAGTSIPDGAKWVADDRGTIYYKVGCFIAVSLPPEHRRYFKTEDEAKAAKLVRSTEKSC